MAQGDTGLAAYDMAHSGTGLPVYASAMQHTSSTGSAATNAEYSLAAQTQAGGDAEYSLAAQTGHGDVDYNVAEYSVAMQDNG